MYFKFSAFFYIPTFIALVQTLVVWHHTIAADSSSSSFSLTSLGYIIPTAARNDDLIIILSACLQVHILSVTNFQPGDFFSLRKKCESWVLALSPVSHSRNTERLLVPWILTPSIPCQCSLFSKCLLSGCWLQNSYSSV